MAHSLAACCLVCHRHPSPSLGPCRRLPRGSDRVRPMRCRHRLRSSGSVGGCRPGRSKARPRRPPPSCWQQRPSSQCTHGSQAGLTRAPAGSLARPCSRPGRAGSSLSRLHATLHSVLARGQQTCRPCCSGHRRPGKAVACQRPCKQQQQRAGTQWRKRSSTCDRRAVRLGAKAALPEGCPCRRLLPGCW